MKKLINKNNQSSLISSILFLILGCILVSNPNELVKFITFIIGFIFFLMGISKVIIYYNDKKKLNIITNNIIYGVILIVMGIVIMFCNSIIEQILRFILGGFIVYTGVVNLLMAINLKKLNTKNWIVLFIISLIMIICGLYIILVSNLIFSTIGIIMIISSISDIVSYIIYNSRNKVI